MVVHIVKPIITLLDCILRRAGFIHSSDSIECKEMALAQQRRFRCLGQNSKGQKMVHHSIRSIQLVRVSSECITMRVHSSNNIECMEMVKVLEQIIRFELHSNKVQCMVLHNIQPIKLEWVSKEQRSFIMELLGNIKCMEKVLRLEFIQILRSLPLSSKDLLWVFRSILPIQLVLVHTQ